MQVQWRAWLRSVAFPSYAQLQEVTGNPERSLGDDTARCEPDCPCCVALRVFGIRARAPLEVSCIKLGGG